VVPEAARVPNVPAAAAVPAARFFGMWAHVLHELQTLHGFPFSSRTIPGGRRAAEAGWPFVFDVVLVDVWFMGWLVDCASAFRTRARQVAKGIQRSLVRCCCWDIVFVERSLNYGSPVDCLQKKSVVDELVIILDYLTPLVRRPETRRSRRA
jgi:hypothetical protein